MKWLKWLLLVSTLLFILLISLTYWVEPFFVNDSAKTKELFQKAGVDYIEHIETINGRQNRWIETGDVNSQNTILFFHGAPGSWADFSSYLIDSNLVSRSHMISIDRLGYGLSTYGQIESDINQQIKIAHNIMERYTVDTLIVVGYSYGGPIAPIYAAHHPDKISKVILLAPVVNPYAEKIFWFNPILDNRIAHSILPKFITAANDEKMTHEASLLAIEQDWKNIQAPVTHLHCQDDWIAPFNQNKEWIESHIRPELLTQVYWSGDSHFLPNNLSERILPILYKALRTNGKK